MASSKKTEKTKAVKTASKKDQIKAKPAKADHKTKEDKKSSSKNTSKSTKTYNIAENGKQVHVEYVGTLDNGEEFDNSKGHGPLKFILGAGQVIKGFDAALSGMKVNETKKIKIKKEDAYGDINTQLVQKVPLSKLPEELKKQLKVGGFLVMRGMQGQHMPAKVVAIEKDTVSIDLNHPLAGKNLNFSIKLLKVEDATEEEGCCGGHGGQGCGCGSSDGEGCGGHEGEEHKHGEDDDCCGGHGGQGCGCK